MSKSDAKPKSERKLIIDVTPMQHVTLEQCIQEQQKRENMGDLPEKMAGSDGEEIHISYAPEKLERSNWGGKIDFILTCVSFAVGLGNVWRFPYLVFKNGGGAFLIPYVLFLAAAGLPIFFMEFGFGQFSSCSAIMCWKISPLFKGIGYGMVTICAYLIIYYNVIISHAVFYFFASFRLKLPWETCGNWWNNNETCIDGTNATRHLVESGINGTQTATEQYYYNYVLELSDGMENFGYPSWKLVICLFVSWTIVVIVLSKGVKSLGKISYFTAIFPYVMLTVLCIRGFMLPGCSRGIWYYFTPRWEKLKEATVWTDAATQIFYSLGICNGPLINLASFNKFRNNCCRDAIIVAIVNCATSVYAGFIVFQYLGYMSVLKNTTIDKVAAEGPGLAFVVYPEALSQMPFPPIWAFFFFLMLVTLGYGSQLSMVECVISSIQDVLTDKMVIKTQAQVKIYRALICAICFLLGLPMVCHGGIYLLTLVDWAVASYPLLLLGLMEILVICYFYGIDQFCRDISLMTKEVPNLYWRITWRFVSPGVMMGLILFYFVASSPLRYGTYTYKFEWKVVAQLIAINPILMVVVFFFYRYCKDGGWILLMEYKKPHATWGPANVENRNEFLEMIKSTDSVARQKIMNRSDTVEEFQVTVDGVPVTNADGDDGSKFFQSRQSIISKLSKVAAEKEANAAGSRPDLNSQLINSTNLVKSQNLHDKSEEQNLLNVTRPESFNQHASSEKS